jgi:hypothetical protein
MFLNNKYTKWYLDKGKTYKELGFNFIPKENLSHE